MKLIQVSDLHFVPPGTLLLGLDPRARLAGAIADINRHHGDAEISGNQVLSRTDARAVA